MFIQEKRNVIQSEVGILNSILISNWFTTHVKMYQIKVNTRNIDLYEFPIHSKLFMQPFILHRYIYELRSVGFNDNAETHLKSLQPKELNDLKIYIDERKNDVDTKNLVIILCS